MSFSTREAKTGRYLDCKAVSLTSLATSKQASECATGNQQPEPNQTTANKEGEITGAVNSRLPQPRHTWHPPFPIAAPLPPILSSFCSFFFHTVSEHFGRGVIDTPLTVGHSTVIHCSTLSSHESEQSPPTTVKGSSPWGKAESSRKLWAETQMFRRSFDKHMVFIQPDNSSFSTALP